MRRHAAAAIIGVFGALGVPAKAQAENGGAKVGHGSGGMSLLRAA